MQFPTPTIFLFCWYQTYIKPPFQFYGEWNLSNRLYFLELLQAIGDLESHPPAPFFVGLREKRRGENSNVKRKIAVLIKQHSWNLQDKQWNEGMHLKTIKMEQLSILNRNHVQQIKKKRLFFICHLSYICLTCLLLYCLIWRAHATCWPASIKYSQITQH